MSKLNVREIINTETAVSPKKGEILFNRLSEKLYNNEIVELDFYGIEDLTTAFLNKAVGNLYNAFSAQKIENSIIPKNLDEVDWFLWEKVKERAAIKFERGTETGNNIREILGDEES